MSDTTILEGIAKTLGTTEPALKLLLSLFAAYPVAIGYRKFFCGKPAVLQHIYFFLSGISIGYFNYGYEIFHALFAVIFSYLTLVILRGTEACVAVTFIFNMVYLLAGYHYSGTDEYDINWTLPQCVLVLRLIGLSFDLYDGNQPEDKLSAKSKEIALKARPTVLEYLGHMFFPGSFMVGPQFPMKRYQDFIAGVYTENIKVESSIPAALKRFGQGILYIITFQMIGLIVSDSSIVTEEFGQKNFFVKLFLMGLWGRSCLYRYISCWLLTEGACILFGLSFNGKDSEGNIKWDGLANVNLKRLETATQFNHYIQSFNTNTNAWVLQYIYKRLKFAGNRYISQGAALIFLAIWHGFHTGYYVCFFFEFMVMLMEKDIQSIVAKNPHVSEFFSKPPVNKIFYILLRIYTFVFMGWCLLPFGLLTSTRYWAAFRHVNYSGMIFFLPWVILYKYIFIIIVRITKPKVEHVE